MSNLFRINASSNRQKLDSSIIGQICFMILFVGVAIAMGSFWMQMGSEWPEWAPGPSPLLFAWIPYAMAAFVVICFLSNIFTKIRKSRSPDTSIMYESRVDTYSAEDVSTYEASGYAEPTYIRILPKFCNNCGSQIDESSVEWIDSMTFACPHCGKRQHAERKPI